MRNSSVFVYNSGVNSETFKIIFITILVCIQASAEPYQLDWEHRDVPVNRQEEEPPSKEVVEFAPRPQFYPRFNTRTEEEKQETPAAVTVQITARQSYDHYEKRYRKVARVESWIYRGGYPENVVHCNQSRHYYYQLWLEDLKPGDRYQVMVTWDDGSQRTVERTIDSAPQLSIVISEPLAFDSGW